jgi:hypothetical protein
MYSVRRQREGNTAAGRLDGRFRAPVEWARGVWPRSFGVNRVDLQRLADTRLDEAGILLRAGKYSGAYYLAGYAVECGFKACIAKTTRKHSYPDRDLANKCYTHDVERLVDLAELKPMLLADPDLLITETSVVNETLLQL